MKDLLKDAFDGAIEGFRVAIPLCLKIILGLIAFGYLWSFLFS